MICLQGQHYVKVAEDNKAWDKISLQLALQGMQTVCSASSRAPVCNIALISRTGNSNQAGLAPLWHLYPEANQSLPRYVLTSGSKAPDGMLG